MLSACYRGMEAVGIQPGFIQVATGPVVTSTADPGDGTCDDAGTGDGCTLREAIDFADPGAAITFAPDVTGTISLTQGELVIRKAVTITGPGASEDVVNRAKAGSSIPVKFGLGGNQGLAIFKPGYPKFVAEACDTGDAPDDVEATTANPAGLTYDAVSQLYTYVWKTDKRWAGRCARLELGLTDGSDHHALFRFVR